MAGRQAKILHDQQINDLLVFASATRNPLRNKLIVLLSVKAGLRAGEIAGLTWDMVLDPTGEVSQAIELHDCIAKKNSGRRIPVNPALRTALTAWCLLTGGNGPVIRSEHGDAMLPVSIVNWFAVLFAELTLAGCSSHSGRRTFITAAARNIHRSGCSLRDVQLLAGHASIETTERYIDGDTDGQRRLVSFL